MKKLNGRLFWKDEKKKCKIKSEVESNKKEDESKKIKRKWEIIFELHLLQKSTGPAKILNKPHFSLDWQGDSGGLITCGKTNEISGVVSFGNECGLPYFPGELNAFLQKSKDFQEKFWFS